MAERQRMAESHAQSSEAMHLALLVRELAAELRGAGIAEAEAEARDIVAAVAGQSRLWPALHPEAVAAPDMVKRARVAAGRRVSGAPFAYCVERAAFRHLTLTVDPRVLIPRQETEQLVELVLQRTRGASGGTVADVGTGCGAVALALATEGNFDMVIGTDISRAALDNARTNALSIAAECNCPVNFICCDTLTGVSATGLRVVVSNPPYIAFDEALVLPGSVRDWEPAEALFSARGGMAATQRVVKAGANALAPGGLLALEVDSRRASLVAELVLSNGRFHDVCVELDLAGRERFVLAIKEN